MRKLNLTKRIKRCRNVHNISDYMRRIGELHEPEGLPEKYEVAFARGISARLRTYFLYNNDLFCRMCGVIPGDIDDLTGQKVKFHIGHVIDKSIGGKEELTNLRALCSTCHQGAKNITTEKPTGLWLLTQVRRAGQDEQRAVLKWLREKFKD